MSQHPYESPLNRDKHASNASSRAQNNISPSADEDGAGLIDLWRILQTLQKWWWLILLIILVFTSATHFAVSRITPVYMATTTVEVKQSERNIVDVSQVENVIADKEFLNTQIELLKSKNLAQDVIESLNLLSDGDFFNTENVNLAGLSRERRMQIATARFRSKISIAPVGRSRLIAVSFEHTNPQRAALITNTLTETFINNTMSRKFNTTAEARRFLEDRLLLVKESLEIAERKLVSYATANNIIIIDGGDTQETTGSLDTAALIGLDSALTKARSDRIAAEATYQQSLQSSFTTDVLLSSTINQLRQEIATLRNEYVEKLAIFKPEYPEMIELNDRIDFLENEIVGETDRFIMGRRDILKDAYDLARIKERNLESRVNSLKGSVMNVRKNSIDYNILKREVDTERTQYDALLQRLKEVSVTNDLGSNLVQIIDPATPPTGPFKPNKLRMTLLALFLSSALGFVIAYLIDIIDDRVKSPEDVKMKLKQILMGVIPDIGQDSAFVEKLNDPQSGISEAYASLRTNLQFSGPDGGPRIIQLTSTRSGEGKSVSSLGLALRFAGLNQRVLLIDADMRLPTFLTGDGTSIGLSGVLTSKANFGAEIQSSRFDNLDILPSGHQVPNPSEILSSPRFNELLEYARSNYSYVIIDSPPVLGLADAPILGAKVDASLLVIQARLLRTPTVKATIERLAASGTKLLGVVLSKYKSSGSGYSGYMDYYKYSYGRTSNEYGETATPDKARKKKGKRKFEIT